MEEWTRADVAARGKGEETLIIIDNNVYEVTRWLEEHPGGREALLQCAGGDASRCFHQVGHSDEAKALRRRFARGTLVSADRWALRQDGQAVEPVPPPTLGELIRAAGPPLLLAVIAILFYMYF